MQPSSKLKRLGRFLRSALDIRLPARDGATRISTPLIVASRTDVSLKPAPIEPAWIREGAPVAKNAVLSTSADGTTSAIVWECTAGAFDWHYDVDETIHFLEGAAVIAADGMAPRRFGAGDVVLFRRGAVARWQVDGHVRKLAFFRRPTPWFVALPMRAAARLKRRPAATPGLVLDAR